MSYYTSYKKLLYQHEVLRAGLEIREHYLKTMVREVYENIGQVLSLVRMQLVILDPEHEQIQKEKIDSSGNLVGQAIRDLRKMCHNFNPDMNLFKGSGLIRALEQDISMLQLTSEPIQIPIIGTPQTIDPSKALILYRILQQIFVYIKENSATQFVGIEIQYAENTVQFITDYMGTKMNWKKSANSIGEENPKLELTPIEKAKLIGGSLKIKNTQPGLVRITLVLPIK